MVSWGVQKIRKGFPPTADVATSGTELDVIEQVLSGPIDPSFRDDATRFERFRFVV